MTEQTLIAVEVNAETGEVTERPFTPEEIEAYNQMKAEVAFKEAEREAEFERVSALKASAKAKLIAGQPLTAEEADVLVI